VILLEKEDRGTRSFGPHLAAGDAAVVFGY
jgi:hypothetical protein